MWRILRAAPCRESVPNAIRRGPAAVPLAPERGAGWAEEQEEQEQDCDLVVIGRQGRHALDELLLGSTTRMVVADGAADVLISNRQIR